MQLQGSHEALHRAHLSLLRPSSCFFLQESALCLPTTEAMGSPQGSEAARQGLAGTQKLLAARPR